MRCGGWGWRSNAIGGLGVLLRFDLGDRMSAAAGVPNERAPRRDGGRIRGRDWKSKIWDVRSNLGFDF